jgi:hypothetical protein
VRFGRWGAVLGGGRGAIATVVIKNTTVVITNTTMVLVLTNTTAYDHHKKTTIRDFRVLVAKMNYPSDPSVRSVRPTVQGPQKRGVGPLTPYINM